MVRNLLTFDIEHWYEGFRYRGINGWQAHPPRDDKPVERLLDLLGNNGQQATMFFTGRYAEEFPHVVKRAAREGHEVASHSYTHNVLPRIANPDEFRSDLVRSVKLLEDLRGGKVKGYRAPKWSISTESREAILRVLLEEGLEYDSSFFPGLFGTERGACIPHQVKLRQGGVIWEIPATTCSLMGMRLPIAGGLYFRLFPGWLTHYALSAGSANTPKMIYLHPYDVDPDCPRLLGGGALFSQVRYLGTKTAWNRLAGVLQQFRFCSVEDWLSRRDAA